MRSRTREGRATRRPQWPMIVLRTPKGWTCPKEVDGVQVEGTWRAHQVPVTGVRENPKHLRDPRGLAAELPPRRAVRRERPPRRRARGARAARRAAHEREPARERRPAPARPRPAGLPRLRRRGRQARDDVERSDARARRLPARPDRPQPRELPLLRPGRDGVEPPGRRLRRHEPRLGRRDGADRRPPRARRARDGGPLRAPLPGLARGLPPDRPARALQLLRGVHPHRRLDVQPAREVVEGHARHPLAEARSHR